MPLLGILAGADVLLYFTGAVNALLRVPDGHLGPWAIYFTLAAAWP